MFGLIGMQPKAVIEKPAFWGDQRFSAANKLTRSISAYKPSLLRLERYILARAISQLAFCPLYDELDTTFLETKIVPFAALTKDNGPGLR